MIGFLLQVLSQVAAYALIALAAVATPRIRKWLASVRSGDRKLDEVLARQQRLEDEIRTLRADLAAHRAGPMGELKRFMDERNKG